MPLSQKAQRTIFGGTLAALLLAAGAYLFLKSDAGSPTSAASSNGILVIAPYRYQGTWVFDDPDVGFRREPFVAGVPGMIDALVNEVPNAKSGFRI